MIPSSLFGNDIHSSPCFSFICVISIIVKLNNKTVVQYIQEYIPASQNSKYKCYFVHTLFKGNKQLLI